MAKIVPFKGFRYNKQNINDLSKVVSPPYDVISPDERVYFHQIHPNNFVRLILGEEFEGDNESDNRFTRAKSYLDEWIKTGILAQDDKPSIFVYQQKFERDGNNKKITGLTCAVKVHNYEDKVILPHENTLAKPKGALAQLLSQTETNLDSIYGLYDDKLGILSLMLDEKTAEVPIMDVTDKDGVRHLLWAISDELEIKTITDFFADKQIAIADGHHRYETALAYSKEMREKCGCKNDCCELPSDYALMTIVNVYEKDLTVLPTHRIVNAVSQELMTALDEKLGEIFKVVDSTSDTILADMAKLKGIGLYRKGRAIVIVAGDECKQALEGSNASKNLELNILHELILDKMLGIDKEKLRNQTNITYTRDSKEAIDAVDIGKEQMCFLLNNIEVKAILDIASAGEKMPQKATYFYPKLISGLVLRKMG